VAFSGNTAYACHVARILVIDDDSDIRDAVTEVLTFEGHEVFSAAEGEQGLVQCRLVRPDLILLDLMMPGMNGWDFLKALRRDEAMAGTPVVVVSALGRVPELPVSGFLPKPFGLDALVALVRTATRQTGNGAGTHA
jgi:two-component system, OmpR family, alkaline phosphatase synthesis response regulator PhoP